jgi:hypothetical protein
MAMLASTWAPRGAAATTQPAQTGQLKLWHPVTITFEGPWTGESATPNPFTDYRLEATFTQGDRKVVVAGYYAADGDAANTSAAEGNKWRVHFVPDRKGRWKYVASFRQGPWVAVSDDPAAGTPGVFDGQHGRFKIGQTDKTGPDFRAKGLLQYVGQRYLKFAGTGEYFIKGGVDSPENILGYYEFDQTPPTHRYAPHAGDFRDGDPTWAGGKGRNIIGAMNYLASKGVNSVYMITMNVRGDGRDTWPWTGRDERERFDCSKLDQWEVVFTHMDRLGLVLHLLTQETENDQLLDKGDLLNHRKLYYRELIARFGHHLGITWNLGEENSNATEQLKAYADYFARLEPYHHAVVLHSFSSLRNQKRKYTPLLGYPSLDGLSLQNRMGDADQSVRHWLSASAASGHVWAVFYDEQAPGGLGVLPDSEDPAHDQPRKQALWAVLMAGGAGAEWYFREDTSLEDFRTRERMYDLAGYALDFFHRYLPFERMAEAPQLVGPGQYCLALAGEVYAVYLPQGGPVQLDLTGQAGPYGVRWYNPRQGGDLQEGPVKQVAGGAQADLGTPPADAQQDWVVLVRKAK